MSKFIIPVTFKFEGTVEVEASTQEEAKNIAESGFGSTLRGGPHTNDSRVTDWDFDVHPDKQFGAAVAKPTESQRG